MGIIAAHTSEISVIYIFNYKIKWDANGGDRTFCKCDQNVHDKLKAVIMSADSLEGSMNTGIQLSVYFDMVSCSKLNMHYWLTFLISQTVLSLRFINYEQGCSRVIWMDPK